MKALAISFTLAALLAAGVATAHALHCTTYCTGNICNTYCY